MTGPTELQAARDAVQGLMFWGAFTPADKNSRLVDTLLSAHRASVLRSLQQETDEETRKRAVMVGVERVKQEYDDVAPITTSEAASLKIHCGLIVDAVASMFTAKHQARIAELEGERDTARKALGPGVFGHKDGVYNICLGYHEEEDEYEWLEVVAKSRLEAAEARVVELERERDKAKRDAEYNGSTLDDWDTKLKAAEAERDTEARQHGRLQHIYLAQCERTTAAEAEVARLRAGLKVYGMHKQFCDRWGNEINNPKRCNCGFDTALQGDAP